MRVFQDLPGEAAALATASRSKSGQTLLENPENKVVLVGVNERKSLPSKEMETKGIEHPPFLRRKRRFLRIRPKSAQNPAHLKARMPLWTLTWP
jgi:hypothetical protein